MVICVNKHSDLLFRPYRIPLVLNVWTPECWDFYTVWYNYVKQQSMIDLAEMLDATSPKTGKRGPYEKKAA